MPYFCIRNHGRMILQNREAPHDGPFVYRLGRKIFILERGVRLPYGLQKNEKNNLIFRLVDMANHKSALKRIRQASVARLKNRYVAKTTRNSVRDLRALTNKEEAKKLYPSVCSMLDRLAKKNVIHKNKASNLKSKLSAHIAKLA